MGGIVETPFLTPFPLVVEPRPDSEIGNNTYESDQNRTMETPRLEPVNI
jgi:hypothetical protein